MKYTTMVDILQKPLSIRKETYGSTVIDKIIVDGNEFGGYKTFTSYWEKTYVKEPERSTSGVIENLNSYATFVTFHLKCDFTMMSIDDYRRLYGLILSKNEFVVTAYNVLTNGPYTCKMYFAPDQMPKLYAMARKLQGDRFVEVLGVQDYTIELIGTNADMDKVSIIYYDANDNVLGSSDQYLNEEFLVGKNIVVPPIDGKNFNGKWKREGTNDEIANKQAISVQFADTNEQGAKTIKFKAQYETTAQYTLSLSWGIGIASKDKNGNDITALTFIPNDALGDTLTKNKIELQTGGIMTYLPLSPTPSLKEGETEHPTHINLGWKKGPYQESTAVNNTTILNVEANTIFYQVFVPVKKSVAFNSNGGPTYSSIMVEYNSSVPLPTPYKEGKVFGGWYLDSELKNKFNGTMLPYDITLYAKWE